MNWWDVLLGFMYGVAVTLYLTSRELDKVVGLLKRAVKLAEDKKS